MSTSLESQLTPLDQNESLEEREEILFDELDLAIKWDRPSILIAVYESEITREAVAKNIESRLSAIGQKVLHFHIEEKLFDVPMILVQSPDHERTVYYITGLKWGGGKGGYNAYRALNMRREFFVDNQMRVVLWLTKSEAAHLPRHAPDFWAFRHRVVDLLDSPSAQKKLNSGRALTWDGWKSSELMIDVDEKITLRETMLADLPSGAESAASRSDLIYTLASYYWAKGELDKSIELLRDGLKLAGEMNDRIAESQFWSGMGLVYHNQMKVKEAAASYEQAVELNPYNTHAWNNLAIAYNDQGDTQKAIQTCKKSIDLKPKNTTAYCILGGLYHQLGQLEDAKECYQTATRLEPKVASYWISLGDIHFEQRRDKEALRSYLKASRLNENNPDALKKVGLVYTRMNRLNDAKKVYKKAIGLSPDDPEISDRLAEIDESP